MRIIPRHSFQFRFSWILKYLNAEKNSVELEKKVSHKLSEYTGCPVNLLFSSARSAFVFLLSRLSLPEGSVFLIPEYNFFVYEKILGKAGFRFRYVPVRQDLLLDADKLEQYIDSDTRAVIVMNLFSRCPNLEKIKLICEKKGVIVIHDNVQSFGSCLSKKPFTAYSDFSLCSFGTGKHVPAFGGGVLSCNAEIDSSGHSNLAEDNWKMDFIKGLFEFVFTRKIIYSFFVFPVFFIINLFARSWLEQVFFENEEHVHMPEAKRMPFFKLFMLEKQIQLYDKSRIKRQALSQLLEKELKKSGIPVPYSEKNCEPDPLFFQLFLSHEICRHLLKRGVDNRYDFCRYSTDRKDSRLSVYLPIHTEMSENDIRYMCEKIRRFF